MKIDVYTIDNKGYFILDNQTEIAKKLGVTKQYVNYLVKRKQRPITKVINGHTFTIDTRRIN